MSRCALLRGATTSRPFVCVSCQSKLRTRQLRNLSNGRALRADLQSISRPAPSAKSLLSILEERGYVKDIAGDRNVLDRLLSSKRVGAYAGIDPTAPSLHLGHLLPLMVMFWLYVHGHHAVSLIGGATARVGDPTGRLTSRQNVDSSVFKTNLTAMHSQMKRLWSNAEQYALRHGHSPDKAPPWRRQLLNNATWMDNLNVVDFLKYLGAGARMGTMLGRDTVKNKMAKGDGMSFAEFTYPLLQAWDWCHMYCKMDVQLQIGGSDQYGNIVAGIDAIHYIAQSHDDPEMRRDVSDPLKAPIGLTVPLLTTSTGAKFGKSAGNAVWLDKNMTSPFDLYGFLLRSSDADVGRYLKLFTFLPMDNITQVMTQHARDPGLRQAQHLLAQEIVCLVHGEGEATATEQQHRTMRQPTLHSLTSKPAASTPDESAATDEDVSVGPTSHQARITLPRSLVVGTPISRVLYHAGIVKTRSEGARLIAKGGVYTGDKADIDGTVEQLEFKQVPAKNAGPAERYFVYTGLLVIRTGKWKVRVVDVVEDQEFDERGLEAPGWDEWKEQREGAA